MTRFRKFSYTDVLLGSALVMLLVGASAAAIGSYRGVFTKYVRVELISDRAGLLMDAGSDVKVSNVVVGRVADVAFDEGQAVISLDIRPEDASRIPSNIGAEITPTTLFGRKFVSLQWPENPSATPIFEHQRIDGTSVTVEVNDAFASLLSVLDEIDPQKVSSTLTAASVAIDGRGQKFGDLMAKVDSYLAAFNNSIPTLQRDIPLFADNLDTLAAASPDFLATVNNLSQTSDTIVEKHTQLSSFLLSFTNLGNRGESFVEDSAVPFVTALDALAPTTRLLAERSPSYPCFFSSLNTSRRYLERGFGGDRPGLNILGTVLMGDPPYTYPDDLPVNGADDAPKCYDYGVDAAPPGHTSFNDGSHAYEPVDSVDDIIGTPFASLIYGMTR